MTQDEKWHVRYQEVIGFIEANHRNPSRHRIEEHDHLNWLLCSTQGSGAEVFFFRVFEGMLQGVLQQFPDVFTYHLKSYHDGIDIKLADKLEASNRLSEGLIVSESMTVAC